jgi:transposase-like protein
MNAIADIETASRFARVVEDSEAVRLGIQVRAARKSVARRLGVAPGTLKNLRSLRAKVVPNWLMVRIRAEFINVLQAEIRRLEHQITIARQIGLDHRDDDLAAAETEIRKAKALIGGAQ